MSEVVKFCINCKHLGLDFETGSCYCSLSNRPDKLPSSLFCDEFCLKSYIERLQEENKRLQMLSCANCGEKYLSPDGSELYEKNVQLQKENEELKNRLKTLDDEEFVYEVTEIEYNNFKKMNEYKQALEEIRDFINPAYFDCKNCKELKKPLTQQNCNGFKYEAILNKIDEVLNDRD